MLINLLMGVALMGLCLALQIALLARTLIYYARHQGALKKGSYLTTLAVLSGVLGLLLFGNLGQVALWALLAELLGEFEQYGDAFYHSAVNFSTLGYGDLVMSEEHRLLGPIQAMNGVLMVGVSTAALMTTLRDAVKHAAVGLAGGNGNADADAVEQLVEKP